VCDASGCEEHRFGSFDVWPPNMRRNRGATTARKGVSIMPNKGDVHVVPHERRWRVEVEVTARPRSTHDTQAAARDTAREIARKNESELLVHSRTGRIRERNTYGRDPRRSKG
jgi:Uncharacterized protein conserved in bacteria (DUF2188)